MRRAKWVPFRHMVVNPAWRQCGHYSCGRCRTAFVGVGATPHEAIEWGDRHALACRGRLA